MVPRQVPRTETRPAQVVGEARELIRVADHFQPLVDEIAAFHLLVTVDENGCLRQVVCAVDR